jgi:hypothetical protein
MGTSMTDHHTQLSPQLQLGDTLTNTLYHTKPSASIQLGTSEKQVGKSLMAEKESKCFCL